MKRFRVPFWQFGQSPNCEDKGVSLYPAAFLPVPILPKILRSLALSGSSSLLTSTASTVSVCRFQQLPCQMRSALQRRAGPYHGLRSLVKPISRSFSRSFVRRPALANAVASAGIRAFRRSDTLSPPHYGGIGGHGFAFSIIKNLIALTL